MTVYQSCLRKIRAIFEKTGILVGRDEISTLCQIMGFTDPTGNQFMDWLGKISDEELKDKIAKMRKKRKILQTYLAQEHRESIYA